MSISERSEAEISIKHFGGEKIWNTPAIKIHSDDWRYDIDKAIESGLIDAGFDRCYDCGEWHPDKNFEYKDDLMLCPNCQLNRENKDIYEKAD